MKDISLINQYQETLKRLENQRDELNSVLLESFENLMTTHYGKKSIIDISEFGFVVSDENGNVIVNTIEFDSESVTMFISEHGKEISWFELTIEDKIELYRELYLNLINN